MEVASLVLRLACSPHRGQLKLGHQKRAKQIRFIVPDFAFREICDEYPLAIDHEGKAYLAFNLAENIPNDRRNQELTEFVLDRCDGLSLEPIVVIGIFGHPKILDKGILNLLNHPGAICAIREHPVYAKKRYV